MAASFERAFSKFSPFLRSCVSRLSFKFDNHIPTKQSLLRSIGCSHRLSYAGFKQYRNDQRKFQGILLMSLFPISKAAMEKEEEEKANTEAEIVKLLSKAITAQNEKDYDTADKNYHEALMTLYRQNADGKIDQKLLIRSQTYIFEKMANLCLLKEQFETAEVLLKDTMKGILQMGMEKTDNAMIELSVKLASVYATLEKFGEAELGYEYCVNTMAKKIKEKGLDADLDTTLLYGLSLESQARFWVVQGEYEKAQENYHLSLDIAKKYLPKEHPQTFVIMNDLSTVYYRKGDFESAEKYMVEAVEGAEVSQMPELAQFYCNQGLICAHLGKFDEAVTCCRKALKIGFKGMDASVMNEAKEALKEVKDMRNAVK